MSNKPEDSASLTAVRDEIDQLDERIQDLINERARLAFRVRESKGGSRDAVNFYRPEREAQVLRKLRERNQGPLSDSEILSALTAVTTHRLRHDCGLEMGAPAQKT